MSKNNENDGWPGTNSVAVMNSLTKLYQEAADVRNYQLCDILRLEIKRCMMQQKYLIPAGQFDGLILDPKSMLGL